jgi:uncharacterized membrane protein YhiD involved in acid resistance
MIFGHDEIVITLRVLGAMLIGGMIGMERTFHGRPAGSAPMPWSASHPPC